MKKTIGILLTVMIMGMALGGCYTKTCEQPVSMKGEG